MRRFSQKAEKPSPEDLRLRTFGQEGLSKMEYDQKVQKYIESEKKMIQFCEDLKSVGSGIRSTASSISSRDPLLITAKAGLLALSNKLIEVGNDAIGAIKAKNDTIFGLGVGAALTSTYQPSAKIKTPSPKRFIPLIGDVVNFAYTLNLKPSDFTDAIKIIFASYKCSGGHPNSKAPLFSGIYPNFADHPELDEQHRSKFEAFSSLALNIGTLLQNVETALALIATFTGQFEFVVAIRAAGGIVQSALLALNILFSPNTYDILAYGQEGFAGGGFDKSSPLSLLNITGYPKLYEAKPIAEEGKAAKESRVQNFILSEIYSDEGEKVAIIFDSLGNTQALAVGEKWPKWGITITGIFSNHVEYKDNSGKIYSIRGNQPSFSNKEIFDQAMKDAANLSTSGVKGDINKLLSKKTSFIISLLYQLKNKYPWIGDGNNAKWINLQSDILSHIIRVPKKRKPTPKPVASTPMMTPINKSRTPGTTDLDREMKRREDLPSL